MYANNLRRSQEKTCGAKPKAGDEVSLSTSGREVQQVLEELQRLPQVRSNLVNNLREEIRQGRYNPKGEDVAEKILGRTIVDRLV